MRKVRWSLMMLAVIVGLGALGACRSLSPDMPVAKVGNGLGKLPHYRDWIDSAGRSPMEPMATDDDATRWP